MTNYELAKSNKSTWATLIYFLLCLHNFGVILMVHFVDYPALSKVQEHIQPVMDIFNDQMTILCYLPAALLIVSSISLYWLSPLNFPRWTIFASIILTIIFVGTTLFFIAPIHSTLPHTGLSESVLQKLLPISLTFQIIPSALQVIIALVLLNIYLKDTKIFSRWLFILFFGLLFYSVGPGFVEGMNYQIWTVIGEKDWLSFRLSGNSMAFFVTFLIPSILPMFLSILFFWWRPKGFPKSFVLIFLLTQIWCLLATVFYFVPKIQIPLLKAYDLNLIADLINYNFLYRGIAITIGEVAIAWSFVRIGQYRMQTE